MHTFYQIKGAMQVYIQEEKSFTCRNCKLLYTICKVWLFVLDSPRITRQEYIDANSGKEKKGDVPTNGRKDEQNMFVTAHTSNDSNAFWTNSWVLSSTRKRAGPQIATRNRMNVLSPSNVVVLSKRRKLYSHKFDRRASFCPLWRGPGCFTTTRVDHTTHTFKINPRIYQSAKCEHYTFEYMLKSLPPFVRCDMHARRCITSRSLVM